MRKVGLVVGENYHVYNRGVEKRLIFNDARDYWRFMSLLVGFQGDANLNPVSRFVNLVRRHAFNENIFREILDTKSVDLISFCLMPNHFHLVLREIKEGGISKFMQRILNAYTKYFNSRYERSGHLFSSRFQSSHIDSNEYLRYLSAYLHLNPNEIKKWHNKAVEYPWSSFMDYSIENRWGRFLNSDVLLDQFDDGEDYKEFIEDTTIMKVERKLQKYIEY